MEKYITYILFTGQIIIWVSGIVWLYAKLDKILCLHKQKLDSIEKHAEYTNGKVAEVMEWKYKNEDFIEGLK